MVISSIDLMNGKVVQLKQGKEKVLEMENPMKLAKEFNKYGEIACIDLDAAMDKGNNYSIIKEICKIAECRVGGGVRSTERAKELVANGAVKIIVGTKAFENDTINHSFLKELKSAIGKNRIVIAIDSINQEIVTKGWQHKTGLNLFDVVKSIEQYASEFLFTCVEKEGMLMGTDIETIKKLRSVTQNKLTVAGGIHSIEEIATLAKIGIDVQLGMSLYTGKVKLDDAFIESLNWEKGFIPTISCDISGQVLMLAYSNRDSLKKTFETNKMWYFARTRDKLWMKGETSGNFQEVIQIRADCDRDALLATVRQKGVACHLESYSCFGDKKFNFNELYDVIKDRLENPVAGSYTATLTDELVREKILEEAQEVVEVKEEKDIIWEAADIFYFLIVLLAKGNISIDDVINELRRRRRIGS